MKNRKSLYNDLKTRPYIHADSIATSKTIGLHSKVEIKWNCGNGHVVEGVPPGNATRIIKKQGRFPCRYCTGRFPYNGVGSLLDRYPEIAAEWDFERNSRTPDSYPPGSGAKVWWICETCSESYSQQIGARTGQGQRHAKCRRLRQSRFERALLFLINIVIPDGAFVQAKVGPHEVDCLSEKMKLIVEFDGHYWHRGEKSRRRDVQKNLNMGSLGYTVIRIREKPLKPILPHSIPVELRGVKISSQLIICLNALISWTETHASYLKLGKERLAEFQRGDGDAVNHHIANALDFSRKSSSNSVSAHPSLSVEWSSKNKASASMVSITVADEKFWWVCPAKLGHPDYLASPLNRRGRAQKSGSRCPKCDALRKKREGAQIKLGQDRRRLLAVQEGSQSVKLAGSAVSALKRYVFSTAAFQNVVDGKFGSGMFFITVSGRQAFKTLLEEHLMRVVLESNLRGKRFFELFHCCIRACVIITGEKPEVQYAKIHTGSDFPRKVLKRALQRAKRNLGYRIGEVGTLSSFVLSSEKEASELIGQLQSEYDKAGNEQWAAPKQKTIRKIAAVIQKAMT